MNFGRIIKNKRASAGLTQIELAEQAGICINTINNIENDKAIPSIATLDSICEVFNIRLSSLIAEGEESQYEDEG